MPELPDVQVFKEYLDATALHERIEHAYVSAHGILNDVTAGTLRSHLRGGCWSRATGTANASSPTSRRTSGSACISA